VQHEPHSLTGPHRSGVPDLPQPDLANCAREPIHIPGLIQPHGLLLVLDRPGLIIRQSSDNSSELIDIPPEDLIDRPLDDLLGADQCAQLRTMLEGDDFFRANPLKFRLPGRPPGRVFDVLLHKVDAELVLEAEPVEDEDSAAFRTYFDELHMAAARLQAARWPHRFIVRGPSFPGVRHPRPGSPALYGQRSPRHPRCLLPAGRAVRGQQDSSGSSPRHEPLRAAQRFSGPS
jgi:hypothetical protein